MTPTTSATSVRPTVVRTRSYRPARPNGSTVVWLHGGGFLWGTLDMPESDAVARELADRGSAVLTLDYALAPFPVVHAGRRARGRARHPAALHQVLAAVREVRQHSDGPLTVGGASAGACLAAAAIVALVDAGEPIVDRAAFVYGYFHRDLSPVPPDIQRQRRGHRRIVHDPRVLAVVNRIYAPVSRSAVPVPRDAFPGGSDLAGFPPSLLVDADHDVFRASAERFAGELRGVGTDVDQRMLPASFHGFLNHPDSPYFAPTIDAIASFVAPGPPASAPAPPPPPPPPPAPAPPPPPPR